MIDYNNVKTGLSSAYASYQRSGGKLKTVKDNVQTQSGYQLNKQKTTVNYFPIMGHGKGSWQMDLMFVSPPYRGIGTILCIINVNSRYAYCYAIKSKKDVAEYLEKFINEAMKDNRLVKYIQSDQGSEFINSRVDKLFTQNDIQHDTVNVGDHAGQAMVERFNQTLRRLITLYISSNDDNDWVSVVPDLVENYNTRFHSKLGTSPINSDEIIAAAQKYSQYLLAKRDFDKIKIGDKVRVLKNKNVFEKGRQQWSNDVYLVEEKVKNLIKIDNGRYYTHYQLQVVSGGETASNKNEMHRDEYKKQKRIIRALNKEGIINDGDTVVLRKKKVHEVYDESLVGRNVERDIRGKKYKGKIVEYDDDGAYKWRVKFDKVPLGRDDEYEYMNRIELKKYLMNSLKK